MITVFIVNNATTKGEWINIPYNNEEKEKVFANLGLGCYDEDGDFVESDDLDYSFTGVKDADYNYDFKFESVIENYDCDIEGLDDFISNVDMCSDYELEQLDAYIEATGYDFNYAFDNYENSIYYSKMSMEDVAEEMIGEGCFGDDMAKIYNNNPRYINIEAIADDLSYDYTEVTNGIIYID